MPNPLQNPEVQGALLHLGVALLTWVGLILPGLGLPVVAVPFIAAAIHYLVTYLSKQVTLFGRGSVQVEADDNDGKTGVV